MKKTLIGIAVMIVILVGAVVIVPGFIPTETYKQQISEQVKAATGRDFKINGEVRLSVLPRLELEVNDVAFANAPGAADAEMAKLAKLLVELDLMPLLSGEVAVDQFVLVDPVIHLEVDKNGKANWVFEKTGDGGAAKQTADAGSGGAALSNLRLGDVRLVNGTVTFKDAQSGRNETLADINMSISLPDLDQRLALDGALVWKGEKIELALNADSPRKLIEGGTSPVDVKVSASPVAFAYKGSFTKAEPIKAGGTITLDVPSIRKLTAWVGTPLDMPGTGLGPFSVKGQLAMTGQKIAFTQAQIGLDAMKATGSLAVDAEQARPFIQAKLDVDTLDLNPYLPPESKESKADADKSADAGPTPWSDEILDLSGLKAADADMAFSTGGILVRKIKVGRSALGVTLKNGKLVAMLNEMQLYDGNGKGRVMVDGSAKVPAVEKSFTLSGVQAEPLLRDASDFERLSGRLELYVNIATKGRSQREMVAVLGGGGGVKFIDGAIKGINLAAMVRNVTSAFMNKGARDVQKTDFAELSGTFKITKGILTNKDLTMQAPLLRLSGAGIVDMPKKTVNYRIEPKAAATTKGQGGGADVAGIMVPVLVEGPWHDLSYKPDLKGMIGAAAKLPSKVGESVGGLVKGGAGGAKDAVSGTLGKLKEIAPAAGGATKPAEAPSSPSTNPLGTVKKLFGK
jgi:AsmA protein